MAAPTPNRLLAETLVQEAASGFETIGRSLAAAYDRWAADGADEETLGWLASLVDQSGWWHGRLTSHLAQPVRSCREYPDGVLR